MASFASMMLFFHIVQVMIVLVCKIKLVNIILTYHTRDALY